MNEPAPRPTCKHCGRTLKRITSPTTGTLIWVHNWNYLRICGLGRGTIAEPTK